MIEREQGRAVHWTSRLEAPSNNPPFVSKLLPITITEREALEFTPVMRKAPKQPLILRLLMVVAPDDTCMAGMKVALVQVIWVSDPNTFTIGG